MLSRFFKLPHRTGSRFDTYLSSVVRVGGSGAPTVDEARKDYAATVKAATLWRGH